MKFSTSNFFNVTEAVRVVVLMMVGVGGVGARKEREKAASRNKGDYLSVIAMNTTDALRRRKPTLSFTLILHNAEKSHPYLLRGKCLKTEVYS